MTDVQEQSVADPEGTNEAATESKPEKAPKVIREPQPCFCQSFEVADPADRDAVFNTGCEQTTKSTFAQGHDARLVSFLVDGFADGYQIRSITNGVTTTHATPADAAALASPALQAKAETATANRAAKLHVKVEKAAAREAKKAEAAVAKAKAKADREAAKEAKAPKTVGAEVVAGSAEGDSTPLAEGQVKIKVGRYEYNATVDDAGNATYTTGSGEVKTVERDGYRLLQEATA